MKKDNYLDMFDSKEKAIDHAMWLNFKYRVAGITFGIITAPKNNFAVCEEVTANDIGVPFLDLLPQNYSKMTYDHIRHIKMDRNMLPHWESIIGMLTTMGGEILRYILHANIPLKKLIRDVLASRGYDENHRWCGFEKAAEIWLK